MDQIVLNKDGLRFERMYEEVLTVLEGEELQRLLKRFFGHYDRLRKLHHQEKAFVHAVFKAYQSLYDPEIVYEEDLKTLSTADARKIDLFYKGLLCLAEKGIEGNSKAAAENRRNLISKINDLFILKPSLFGLGIDINALIRKALNSYKNPL